MRKAPFLLLIFLAWANVIVAQVTPIENSELNYRLVGFSVPHHAGSKYAIEIAEGRYNNNDSFRKNIIVTQKSPENKIIAEVPAFGKEYTWRVVYSNGSVEKNSELHHFSTLTVLEVNPDSTRLRVVVPSSKYADDYVFVDGNKVLYDMNGQPVWFLPEMDGRRMNNRGQRPRDLKASPWGTITFMINEHMYEINYNCDILWQEPQNTFRGQLAPKNRFDRVYHHEFAHMGNGNYMTLGMETALWDLPESDVDSNFVRKHPGIIRDSGKIRQKVMSGRVIEFDKNHNLIWSWNSVDYFKGSDIYNRRRPNGFFNMSDTHENAFDFDEKTKTIYVSFRNINRIVEIKYPEGNIVNVFGVLYSAGEHEFFNDIFCGQHSVRHSSDGYLYMYNNNSCNRGCQMPSIVMIADTLTNAGQMTKIWEYSCKIYGMSDSEQLKLNFETGGNVSELPDHSIFCCMGGMCSETFIVNRDKSVLWCALPEKWSRIENKWVPAPSYRASVITRAELENIIWGEPQKAKK